MKNRSLLLLVAIVVLFAGCDDNNNVVQKDNFMLTFKVSYDGQPIEKAKVLPYGDKSISFDKFNTFLSDITLLKGTEEVKLSDIEWVDCTPDAAVDNKAVDVSFQYTVPDGDYTGLKLGYGVRADLNAKKPSDFPVGHPLYLENEYWVGWNSYIFTKIQGKYDMDGNGATETILFYHCGADTVYNTATFARTIRVSGDAALTVEFDLKKLFTFDGQLLDLNDPLNQATSHSASNIALGLKMMNNMKNATTLE